MQSTNRANISPRRSKRGRRLLRLGLGLLLGYAGYAVLLASLQRQLLFPASRAHPDVDPGRGQRGLERLWRKIPGGSVEAWFLPGASAARETPAAAVIFAHGNAELIEYWPEVLAPYRRWGVSLLLVEYRGYGRSGGSPAQAAITDDFIYFYDQLRRRPDVDPRRIVFHGRSLGGGVVCSLARHRTPAAMVLQSTFTSIHAMARRFLLPRFLVRDPFDNLATIEHATHPLLIMHGRRDRLIPFRQAAQLSDAARHGRLLAFDGGHNDGGWQRFWPEIRRFLDDSGVLIAGPSK